MALAGELCAHLVATAKIVDRHVADGLVGQIADEDGGHVKAGQRVVHAMQREVADDQAIGRLAKF